MRSVLPGMPLDQADATQFLCVTQPRISDLMRGEINQFSLHTLVGMATAAGLQVEVRITEAG